MEYMDLVSDVESDRFGELRARMSSGGLNSVASPLCYTGYNDDYFRLTCRRF